MSQPECPQKSPIVQEETPGEKWWCSCGRSQKQPFCDGSHAGTGFTPLNVKIEEDRKVAWCACKATKSAPYCDGSHRDL